LTGEAQRNDRTLISPKNLAAIAASLLSREVEVGSVARRRVAVYPLTLTSCPGFTLSVLPRKPVNPDVFCGFIPSIPFPLRIQTPSNHRTPKPGRVSQKAFAVTTQFDFCLPAAIVDFLISQGIPVKSDSSKCR
jgi:hypothetical protein